MTRYLLKRGKGASRRKAHLAKFGPDGGVAGAWCGRTGFDLNSNVPLVRRCKDCLRRKAEAGSSD